MPFFITNPQEMTVRILLKGSVTLFFCVLMLGLFLAATSVLGAGYWEEPYLSQKNTRHMSISVMLIVVSLALLWGGHEATSGCKKIILQEDFVFQDRGAAKRIRWQAKTALGLIWWYKWVLAAGLLLGLFLYIGKSIGITPYCEFARNLLTAIEPVLLFCMMLFPLVWVALAHEFTGPTSLQQP